MVEAVAAPLDHKDKPLQGTAGRTFRVLGVPVTATNMASAVGTIESWSSDDQGRMVIIRDVHGVVFAHENAAFRQLHETADMITPDGVPLVWLGRLAGQDVSRVCGSDLMETMIASSQTSGVRHYFYGGKTGIAEKLQAEMLRRFPDAKIVGTGTPPFRSLTDDEIVSIARKIEASGADVVWVGISSPKQEALMERLKAHSRATFIGVGAAFDFQSGTVKRAPHWIRNTGFEWAWRVMQEPRRLGRRYLHTIPTFLARLLVDDVLLRGRR